MRVRTGGTLLFLLHAPLRVVAQADSPAHGSGTCTTCRIDAVLVALLGLSTREDGGLRAWPAALTRDRFGAYLAVQPDARHAGIWLFNPAGRQDGYVSRGGDAPGEYRRPYLVWKDLGDSIHVLDYALHRHTVLTPDRHFAWASPIPPNVHAAVVLPGGQLLVNAMDESADGSGAYLHPLEADGSERREFPALRANPWPGSWTRALALAANGTIWAVRNSYRYEIEHWDPEGHLLALIAPSRDWFAPYDTFVPPGDHHRPSPAVMAAWMDTTTSLLWVLGVPAGPRGRNSGELPGARRNGAYCGDLPDETQVPARQYASIIINDN